MERRPIEPSRSDIASVRAALDPSTVADELYERIRRLYPICRSITGEGVRQTLGLLSAEIDLRTEEVATGTGVFDWTIPKEWNIRDAYIKDRNGTRIVDFHASNLHVVSYSVPVRARMSLAALRPHLFSIPERPDWIPYKTSYYAERWGFCVSQRQLESMRDEEYDVCIDSTLEPGHLTFGECVLAGCESDEILFSCHVCHPSLCNDNLSGISVAVTLARLLAGVARRYTYRFLFVPGTIGAITWLARHEETTARIRDGLVLACLGDRGTMSYKRSRAGNSDTDRVVAHVLSTSGSEHNIEDFSPYGYDERQYCSPGFNLPVGVLSRTPHGRFPEYHTSADNLELMDRASLAGSLFTCLRFIETIEGNGVFLSRNPKCEPQLGKRGLYASMGGHRDEQRSREEALLWVLNLSDGRHSLLDIAERSRLPFETIRMAATALLDCGLLEERGAVAAIPFSLP
jgi:aminopeptidase-like protein